MRQLLGVPISKVGCLESVQVLEVCPHKNLKWKAGYDTLTKFAMYPPWRRVGIIDNYGNIILDPVASILIFMTLTPSTNPPVGKIALQRN